MFNSTFLFYHFLTLDHSAIHWVKVFMSTNLFPIWGISSPLNIALGFSTWIMIYFIWAIQSSSFRSNFCSPAYLYHQGEQQGIDFVQVVYCFIVSCDRTKSWSQRIGYLFNLSTWGFHQWIASCLSITGFALSIHPYSFIIRPSRDSLLYSEECLPTLLVSYCHLLARVPYHHWHCLFQPDPSRSLRFFCSASLADLAVPVQTQTSLSWAASTY